MQPTRQPNNNRKKKETPRRSLNRFLGSFGTGLLIFFMLIMAYFRAPAATLTPYLYTQIGFAMLGGLLVFSHVPDNLSLAGIVMIAVCGAAGAWLTVRERRNAAS